MPCFWVHPCNTQNAIREILSNGSHAVGPLSYLMIWMGVVGAAVGLYLPKAMVTKGAGDDIESEEL